MGRYRSFTYFEPGDCNTVCDRLGFKMKLSQTVREWNGHRVSVDAYNERHPQLDPVIPEPQKTYPDARYESEEEIQVPEITYYT